MAGASHACFAPWLGGQPGASGDAPADGVPPRQSSPEEMAGPYEGDQ